MCGVYTPLITNSVGKYITSVFAITGSAKIAERPNMVTTNALCKIGGIYGDVGRSEAEEIDGR